VHSALRHHFRKAAIAEHEMRIRRQAHDCLVAISLTACSVVRGWMTVYFGRNPDRGNGVRMPRQFAQSSRWQTQARFSVLIRRDVLEGLPASVAPGHIRAMRGQGASVARLGRHYATREVLYPKFALADNGWKVEATNLDSRRALSAGATHRRSARAAWDTPSLDRSLPINSLKASPGGRLQSPQLVPCPF
jgi:hypothetical protein